MRAAGWLPVLALWAGSGCLFHPGEVAPTPADAEVGVEDCAIYAGALRHARHRLGVSVGQTLAVQSTSDARMDCRVVQASKDCNEAEEESVRRSRSLRTCRFAPELGVVLLERNRAIELLNRPGCGSPSECLLGAGVSSGQMVALGRAFMDEEGLAIVEVATANGSAFQSVLKRDATGSWEVTEQSDVNK